MKRLIFVLLLCATCLTLLYCNHTPVSGNTKQTTIAGAWQLGDDIIPYPAPFQSKPAIDCDDIALFTGDFIRYALSDSDNFTIEYAYGNIGMAGESRIACNHFWVVVTDTMGEKYPYDMGFYWYDDQHLDYYTVSRDFVLQAALMD